jgi:hypothetical protein
LLGVRNWVLSLKSKVESPKFKVKALSNLRLKTSDLGLRTT